jgi:hypothetical protein
MSYKDPTYVIFDGDKDKQPYAFMKGWNALEHIDFNFTDAHELDSMTPRAQDEAYVKSNLRKRMERAKQIIVLVGDSTKHLHRFVTWEINLALELELPVIVVNLNNKRQLDAERCPTALRDAAAVHVSFKLKIIKHALDHWPAEYRNLRAQQKAIGARHYSDEVYRNIGVAA